MSKILLIRILGNDLQGLHGKNQTFENLKFTLQNEPNFKNTTKMYLLNRIYDIKIKSDIINLLKKYNNNYLDIPFDINEFKEINYNNRIDLLAQSYNPKNNKELFNLLKQYTIYITNSNQARNYCINYGKKKGYDWILPLDSNSYFTNEYFEQMNEIMKNKNLEYLIIPQLRLNDLNLVNNDIINRPYLLDKINEHEPQIGFSIKTEIIYNENIPYGTSEKAELLRVLQVPGEWHSWTLHTKYYGIKDRPRIDAKYKIVSKVIRLNAFQKNNKKVNFNNRIIGIYNLVRKVRNDINNNNNLIENYENFNNKKIKSSIIKKVILIILLFTVAYILIKKKINITKKNLFLFIILLILIYLLNLRLENFDNDKNKFDKMKILNEKKWQNYRLADILKGYFYKVKQINYLNNIEKNMPNSIGGQYIKLTKKFEDKNINLKIINKIVNKKVKEENIILPKEDEIILHLRIGDVIKDYNPTTDNFIFNKKYFYVTELDILERILNDLKSKKIILVFGSHKRNVNKYANDMYIYKVKQILKKKKFVFRVLNNNDPDKDFIFMSNSKTFIRSGGGYSRIIARIVQEKGGIVYNPDKIKNNL